MVITAWRRRCDAFGRGMTVLRDAFGMAVGVVRVIATAIGGMKVSPVLWRGGTRGRDRTAAGEWAADHGPMACPRARVRMKISRPW